MCKNCGCETSGMKIQHPCGCTDKDCTCNSVSEFQTEPKAGPQCCRHPMKRIKKLNVKEVKK
ncbi:MAG: hypothetical protein BV459_00930 [Thermoplasmata archaeon M11B2D]|nr:MAG: hypothetical protein BV459_00930 [Thermoplasmata archaeon M11B2D]PNX53724.1 MAG: hypothetical protein BV458_02945 [Thermoplasmata archaeon M9B2D]